MSREMTYKEQLKALGLYRSVFDPEIRMLADMERDHQRTRKAWIAAGRPVEGDLYAALTQQRRDILAHRDALGLTPKGFRRLRPLVGTDAADEKIPDPPTILGFVRDKLA